MVWMCKRSQVSPSREVQEELTAEAQRNLRLCIQANDRRRRRSKRIHINPMIAAGISDQYHMNTEKIRPMKIAPLGPLNQLPGVVSK